MQSLICHRGLGIDAREVSITTHYEDSNAACPRAIPPSLPGFEEANVPQYLNNTPNTGGSGFQEWPSEEGYLNLC